MIGRAGDSRSTITFLRWIFVLQGELTALSPAMAVGDRAPTSAVGMFPHGASSIGASDMCGKSGSGVRAFRIFTTLMRTVRSDIVRVAAGRGNSSRRSPAVCFVGTLGESPLDSRNSLLS